MRGPHHSNLRAFYYFCISRKRWKDDSLPPKKPAQQQNQTVAERVCLNGDCRRRNMLQNYSRSMLKFPFPPLLSVSLQERCRLLGCTEACKITGLRSSSALPVRRQSSGSLWHPRTPHLWKSSAHPAPAVTLTASLKKAQRTSATSVCVDAFV